MDKMKRIALVSALCVLAAGQVAFAAPGKTGSSNQAVYIPLISKGFQHQFWQAVKSGAEKAAKDYNVVITFEGPESETMVDKQIDMLSAVIAKKPAAIGLAALDSQAVAPLLAKAKKAGIPVIGFDSGVASDIPVTTAATDNYNAAVLAADKMASLIGGSGEVAVVAADQTGKSNVDRRDGFVNRIKEKYPNIKVVDVQYAPDQLSATDVTKAIIQSRKNLKGIFGANEGCAIGVANAVSEMKKVGSLVVIGYDSGKLQMDAIRNGVMAGAITQNPIGMGYKTVEAAVKALKGEKLPAKIDTGFFWYDKTNMDSADIKPLLYQ
jgi:ribose transport system substrate-binding protein